MINPILDPVVELSEYKTITKDNNNKEIEMPLVPKHIIDFYNDNKDMKKYYDNVYGIFSSNDNFNEYSKLCKCIKSDNPIQTIVDTIKDIK
jgi:hypothetical protein